jgi:hypothetical protein
MSIFDSVVDVTLVAMVLAVTFLPASLLWLWFSGKIGSRVFMRYKKRIDAVYNGSYDTEEECLRRLNETRMEIYEIFHRRYDEEAMEMKEIRYRRNLLLLFLAILSLGIWVFIKPNVYKDREFGVLNKKISTYIKKVSNSSSQ